MRNSARSLPPVIGLLSILALTLASQIQAQALGWGCLQKYTEKFTHKYPPGQYTKTAVELDFKDEGAGSDAKLLRGGIRPLVKAGVLAGVVDVADAVRTLVLPFEYQATAFNHEKDGASFELVSNLQSLAQQA